MSSPPTTLGQYQIIREIARSNDIVYEAYDPLMNRRVAVKELAMPTGMTDAQKVDRVSRFKREAQAAGTLNHPNIMTVYSFSEEAGRTFMAMEYLDGHTLRNEIDTKGFIPVHQAIEMAIKVLEGLGHAHSKGVIHRDIKPDNIQILSNGEVKITDFGIARLTFQPNLTMDGQVFGTPSYMSPEQVVGREIDARSDLFSVGVVLYEMISGSKPFTGDSVVTITYAIMNKDPQQPTQATWSLWQVLQRALDKSPQLRYSSAADMIDALRDAERQAQSGLMTSAPPQQTGAYSSSPYSPALAPPMPVNPYAQPPSPYPTAYNPYQSQPPVVNPNTYGAYQTPYNPSGGYPVQQSPYVPMPSMPPPGPIPIYYPPPPRPPLLKPETVVFLRKTALAALILGSLLAIMLVITAAIVNTYQQGNAKVKDSQIATQIASLDSHLPINERISQAERLLSQVPIAKNSDAAKNVALLYETSGKQALADNHPVEAESAFQRGLELDSTNAALYSELGSLYYDDAVNRAANEADQVKLLVNSGDNWYLAHQNSSNPAQREQFGQSAASTYVSAIRIVERIGGGDPKVIRSYLYKAREAAPNNSPWRATVQDMLNSYGG